METESVQVLDQQQTEQAQLDHNTDQNDHDKNPKAPPVLLEKRKPTKQRAQTSKPTNKKEQKRPDWNYFTYLNDSKREKLFQMPELPKTKKKSKKSKNSKKVRIKSAPTHTSEAKQTDEEKLKSKEISSPSSGSSSSSSDDSDEEKPREDDKRRVSTTDSNKSECIFESKKSVTTHDESKSTLKRPKFRTTVDMDKINFDGVFNYHEELNYRVEEALNNLHMSTTYKNLLRSMKANVNSYNRIRNYHNKLMLESEYYLRPMPAIATSSSTTTVNKSTKSLYMYTRH